MQTETREILYWFGPRDLRPVPKQPAWDFLYPDFEHPKINFLYTIWQNTICQIYTTLLYTKIITLLLITMYPISLETCMWL